MEYYRVTFHCDYYSCVVEKTLGGEFVDSTRVNLVEFLNDNGWKQTRAGSLRCPSHVPQHKEEELEAIK